MKKINQDLHFELGSYIGNEIDNKINAIEFETHIINNKKWANGI